MTNEEWWEKIEKTYNHENSKWILSDALRAVIELHKPDKFGFCYCSDIPSKCPTKEAIEKELK